MAENAKAFARFFTPTPCVARVCPVAANRKRSRSKLRRKNIVAPQKQSLCFTKWCLHFSGRKNLTCLVIATERTNYVELLSSSHDFDFDWIPSLQPGEAKSGALWRYGAMLPSDGSLPAPPGAPPTSVPGAMPNGPYLDVGVPRAQQL